MLFSPNSSCFVSIRTCFHRLKYRFYSFVGLSIDHFTFVIDRSFIILGPILVLLAWLILSYFLYSYFYHLAPYAKFDPWQFPYSIQTVIGLFLLFSIYYNHIAAVFTSPGYSPDSVPSSHYISNDLSSFLSPSDGLVYSSPLNSLENCSKCGRPKFDRAHCCSSCGRCIMRMDHVSDNILFISFIALFSHYHHSVCFVSLSALSMVSLYLTLSHSSVFIV
jgi:hypothetical protein